MNYLLFLVFSLLAFTCHGQNIKTTPTNKQYSLLRGGPGAFNANRENGKKHAGVDIVANQSSSDKNIYAVYAVADGSIAYAKLNGGEETGYGYTVVIDHGDNNYTQYSHLATQASSGMVKLKDKVKKGQLIGYLADLANNERSSGNVRADVVKPYDKIQLHLECFNAPAGRTSTGGLAELKKDSFLTDPTEDLKKLGYNSF